MVTEAACLSILAVVIIYLIISWNQLPSEVPMHYDINGNVDSMGGKDGVIALPIISVFIYILLTVIGRFPQIWNTGVKVTDENKERVYRIIKNLLNTLKLLLVVYFSYLTLNFIIPLKFDIMSVFVFLTLMFGSVVYFIVKLARAR